MSGFLLAAPFILASLLLMRLILRASRKPPLIELTRFRGNTAGIAYYEHRRDAFGHSTARNVRDAREVQS